MSNCSKPRVRISAEYHDTHSLVRRFGLNTVCEEAACPNIGDCWGRGHVTVMILGRNCTRACTFCNIASGNPEEVDKYEPLKIVRLLKELKIRNINLKHVVITSVDRDDLLDGGASQYIKVISEIRKSLPQITIEVLTPDFLHKNKEYLLIAESGPEVYNHNLETIPRLYGEVRPKANYYHSLRLLDEVKKARPNIYTKSGLMLGLGESRSEIARVMDDLRIANVDVITIGQYYQPSPSHYPQITVSIEEFEYYKKIAKRKGFKSFSISPLTRSSFNAGNDLNNLQSLRKEK